MNARNAIQRATTSFGVAAVSDVEGMTNCGAGPGFGPIANFRSTASLYVNSSCFGGTLTVPLADGTVRSRVACAHAVAGSANHAASAASATRRTRVLRGVEVSSATTAEGYA